MKTVSDLFMPVSVEIIEFNSGLEANPELVNSDPYGEGWMIKVKLSDSAEVEGLLSSTDYQNLIGSLVDTIQESWLMPAFFLL